MSSYVTVTKKVSQIYAVSTEAGIFVSADAFSEDEQPMSGFVTRNSDGKIVGTIVNESLSSAHSDWQEKNPAQTNHVKKWTKIFQTIFTLIIASFAMIRNSNITLFVSLVWVISLFTSSLYNVSYYFAMLTFFKIKEPIIAKYHAAEHMVFCAAREFQRVPTLNEISRESMYSYKCSITESLLLPTAVSVIRTLIISASVFFIWPGLLYLSNIWSNTWEYNFLFLILVIMVALIVKLLKGVPTFVDKQLRKEGLFLKIMQSSVVSMPGKEEMEIAQQASNLRFLMNEIINKDSEGYKVEDISFDLISKRAIYTFCNGKVGQITLIEYINSVMNLLNADVKEANPKKTEESSKETELGTFQTTYYNGGMPPEAPV